MRFVRVLPWLWWQRVRKRPGLELLAVVGIAIGVALLFAVQIANTSVTGSVRELTEGIAGSSSLAVVARDPHGVDERIADRASNVDGVRAAAPLLFTRAGLTRSGGDDRPVDVQLVGVDRRFEQVNPALVEATGGARHLGDRAVVLLPAGVADSVGASVGSPVELSVAGRAHTVVVAGIVAHEQAGPLAESAIVVAPLRLAQQLAGTSDRVTQLLVATDRGRARQARTGLLRLADDRADVVPSDHEATVVEQAAAPNEQSTGMFAAISMLVGLLFTFNAVLLTLPERRRFIAELRMQGFGRAQLTTLVVFEAVAIGAAGSMLGLLLGDLLSREVFHAVPGYLALAFPIGSQRIVSAEAVVIAVVGGMLASFVAAARLLVDATTSKPLVGAYRGGDEATEALPRRARPWLVAAAGALVAFASAIYLAIPALTVVGASVLGVTGVLLLPSALGGVLRIADRLSNARAGRLLSLAVAQLRTGETRAVALAATGALAVFGSVTIEGAHQDLLRGLDDVQVSLVPADVWVVVGDDENSLTTIPFTPPATLDAIEGSPLVASVRPHRAALVDLDDNRVWVMARDPGNSDAIVPGQLVDGSQEDAERALRAGGSLAISASLADRLGVGVGDTVALPTPSGTRRLRVAATTTNHGWAPGTILLDARAYRRWWPADDVTGVEVDLAPGVSQEDGRRLVASALPRGSALTVETGARRIERFQQLSRDGLNRLSQISTLMLLGAALAMAAAMSGTIWQQRRRTAVLRMQGFDPGQIWLALLLQCTVVLVVGAGVGALTGLAGQALASQWVAQTTGFPATSSPALALAAVTFAGVALVAMVVVALPGWVVARVSPTLSLEGD